MTGAPLIVQAFPDDATPAQALAGALSAPVAEVALHRFPDGEILPHAPPGARVTAVYCALSQPSEKLLALLLAADAWRRDPAVARLVLVAPYLPYMRQDRVFRAGEPISQAVVCSWLAERFDDIVTVDPHLHRTTNLNATFPQARWRMLSATAPMAAVLLQRNAEDLLIVGPDSESAPMVDALAAATGAEGAVFSKVRHGDRNVTLTAPEGLRVTGRPVVVRDDICASGGTLARLAADLKGRGARSLDVVVTHALFDASGAAQMRAAGVDRIFSCDGCPHPTNAIALAPVLAEAVRSVLSEWKPEEGRGDN